MSFPESPYSDIESYCDDYLQQVSRAAASLSRPAMDEAARVLVEAYRDERTVYVCGNGGSTSISNHLVCDHLKSVQTDTRLRPRLVSLSANLELISAIANDIGYSDVFVYQLQTLAKPGDVLITISSSGDSENVVRACEWARANDVATIALTGFAGGRTGELAQTHVHVEADNYGVIEDVHQSVMHILAQYLRQAHMSRGAIASTKF